MTEKTCTMCKKTKPLSEFYNRHDTPDKLDYICKKDRQFKSKDTLTGNMAGSTRITLERLAQQGIPACSRTTSRSLYNWERPTYADLIAYGIVLIEAKLSRADKPLWVWTNRERTAQDDIVILIDRAENKDDWYIFPNNSPIFYHDDFTGKGRKPKLAGQHKRGLTLSKQHADTFKQALERWSLISEVFERKIEQLRQANDPIQKVR